MNIFAELANRSAVIWYLCESKFYVHSTRSLSSNKQLDYHWRKFDVSDLQRWGADSYKSQYQPCHCLVYLFVPHCPPRDRGFLCVSRDSIEQLEIRARILIVWFQSKYLPLTQDYLLLHGRLIWQRSHQAYFVHGST